MSDWNPFTVGWTEFGLRVFVITFTVVLLLLILAVAVKAALGAWGAARWVARKTTGRR